MKRWMISLAPNRRTKFVSFTSRLVGKRHSIGARSSSPLPQGTLCCLDLSPAPGLRPLPKQNPPPGLPLHFPHQHPLVFGTNPDLAPLPPGLLTGGTMVVMYPAPFPTAMLSLWLGHPIASMGFLCSSD